MRAGERVNEVITEFAPPEVDRRHIDISHRGTVPRPFRTESIHGRVKLSKPKPPKTPGPRVAWNRGMGLKRDDVDRLRADGRTVVQIAERLGCSRGAVYACIHREKGADPMAAEVAYEAATCPKCGGRKWAEKPQCSVCSQKTRRRGPRTANQGPQQPAGSIAEPWDVESSPEGLAVPLEGGN